MTSVIILTKQVIIVVLDLWNVLRNEPVTYINLTYAVLSITAHLNSDELSLTEQNQAISSEKYDMFPEQNFVYSWQVKAKEQ